MYDVTHVIFVALMTTAVQIVNEKSGMCVVKDLII